MRERTDKIESQIEEERGALRANLDELGSRIRSATDWRLQFRGKPLLGLGLAFGGGLLLASLFRGTRTYPHSSTIPRSSRGQLLSVWETIQGALVGVAANKVTEALGEVIPGFREHLAKAPAAFESGRPGNGQDAHGEADSKAVRRHRVSAERYTR